MSVTILVLGGTSAVVVVAAATAASRMRGKDASGPEAARRERERMAVRAGGSPPPAPQLVGHYQPSAETVELVRAGKLIDAIKVVRDECGMGLKDAKEYVEFIEARLKAEPGLRVDQLDTEELAEGVRRAAAADYAPSAKVTALVNEGEIIQAIKQVRTESGLDLREAKEVVERLKRKV